MAEARRKKLKARKLIKRKAKHDAMKKRQEKANRVKHASSK